MKTNSNFNLSIKNTLAIVLFLCLLLGLRWSWFYLFPTSEHPEITDGVLDLRGWDLEDAAPMSLNGEWTFYPNKLYTYNDLAKEDMEASRSRVPGDWRSSFPGQPDSSFGYGTYQLRILTDPLEKPVTFWMQKIEASSTVEVNGFIEGTIGQPAANAEDYVPNRVSYTSTYTERGVEELVVLIRVANYENPYEGGILNSVRFGTQAAIDNERWYSIGFQLITFVVLLLHGLYAFILYWFNRQERSLLLFCLLALSAGISVVSDHDNVLMIWFPFDYDWSMKIRLLSYMWVAFFILYFFRSFSKFTEGSKWFKLYAAALIAYSGFIVAASPELIHARFEGIRLFSILYLVPFAWLIYIAVKMYVMQRTKDEIVFLLMSASAVFSSAIMGAVNGFLEIETIYYPVDIIAAIIGFSAYWFKKYFHHSQENAMLNRQLREADKLKDQFLANTSHELRTPLHGIMNIAETVLGHEKERINAQSRKDMELLIAISRRMSGLLADLLDTVQIREQRIKLKKPLYIQAVVPGVVNMLSYMLENKPIRIAVELGDMPAVWADEKRMIQVMQNLLHNAIKFTEHGVISITANIRHGKFWVHVSDTGVGMDEETISRIMLPYEQGSQGISDGRGLGLGLSICKQLIELHEGELEVRSKPGEGSVFSFCLPFDESHSKPAVQEPASLEHHAAQSQLAAAGSPIPQDRPTASAGDEPSQQGQLRILAVDDDPVNLNVLRAILSTEPYDIETVSSGAEALSRLDRQQWDLLIADVMMPGMSGYELTKAVREQYSLSELPVLLLTARARPADIYTGFVSGANDYVTKPVDGMELKYRIRALMGLKQSVNDLLRMEAAYLQAQIQPHFIFNTLNSIMALSVIDLDKMRQLGEAFATYLRISFDFINTRQFVELAHELELVKAYLFVEQARFGDRLSVRWEVDLDGQLQLPPLTIQPLVENAVKHGLLSRLQGGTVHIRAVRQDGLVRIEVRDDGAGMDAGTVERVLNQPHKRKRGIGLYNTNRRLIQLYGQGLSVSSKPDAGTSVTFVIPDASNT